jgi:hypothetical protein
MRDILFQVRSAFYIALSGLTYNSQVEVYDYKAPVNSQNTYVILSEQTDDISNTRNCTLHTTTMLIDIVSIFETGGFGRKITDEVADIVLQRITSTNINSVLNTYSLNATDINLVSSNGLIEEYETETVIRRLLRISMIVS